MNLRIDVPVTSPYMDNRFRCKLNSILKNFLPHNRFVRQIFRHIHNALNVELFDLRVISHIVLSHKLIDPTAWLPTLKANWIDLEIQIKTDSTNE